VIRPCAAIIRSGPRRGQRCNVTPAGYRLKDGSLSCAVHRHIETLEEVGNSTGSNCRRHADAVAMNLWPSRGMEIHGIEIKVSRSDWLRELSNPKKADDVACYCDRWWLAVSDEKIVQTGELPATWGLYVFTAGKLVCKVEAALLQAEPLNRGFVGAMLRRASESLKDARDEGHAAGFDEGSKLGPEEHQQVVKRLESELDGYKTAIANFKESSGLELFPWESGEVGKAVREVMQIRRRNWMGAPDPTEAVEAAAKSLENAAAHLRRDAERHVETERKVVEAALKTRRASNG